MKLELSGDEVAVIVLEYAQAKFPGQFDKIESAESYRPVQGLVLTKAEPAEPLDKSE